MTGANSGIGFATARLLFEEGVTVIAADKDIDKLDEQTNFHVKQVRSGTGEVRVEKGLSKGKS